ncbi:MAG TPA: RNA polymerase sigma-70 factor [Bacteroidales bacterium]|nr:RNA polymerase sigma-70 factor [Bacteroidales bacterium]
MKYISLESENQLIKKLSKGNIQAFNTLFRAYSPLLYRFAYGYLKSCPDSEEVVQEVFLKIWEKHKELKDNFSFKSYLFSIAFNLILKHFRRSEYFKRYINSGISNDFDTQTSDKVNYDSLHEYIKELANKLPEKRRDIFIKSRFEGLKVNEISEILKISHKTVENQLTSALKFIRDNLSREIMK